MSLEDLAIQVLIQGGTSALFLGAVLLWLGTKFEKALTQNSQVIGECCEVMRNATDALEKRRK